MSGSTIDTLKLFLLSRYTAEARMLNMENMAEDPVLTQAGLLAPGVKGAPSNMAGAVWKLAAQLFPDVRLDPTSPHRPLAHLISSHSSSPFPSPTTTSLPSFRSPPST